VCTVGHYADNESPPELIRSKHLVTESPIAFISSASPFMEQYNMCSSVKISFKPAQYQTYLPINSTTLNFSKIL
jgi:hypothetical protein